MNEKLTPVEERFLPLLSEKQKILKKDVIEKWIEASLSYQDMADRLGISRERARQIKNEIERKGHLPDSWSPHSGRKLKK